MYTDMKAGKVLTGILILLLIAGIAGCKKKKEEEPSQNAQTGYVGTLYLDYSRGFPSFSVRDQLSATVSKDGKLTCGTSDSKPIVTEGTLYDGATPKLRMRLDGSMTFYEAEGNTFTVNNTEYLSVLVHSTIQYQVTLWVWDRQNMQSS
jgi:uncharacterized lipoprotein NlpE involved in copper resistance